METSRPKCRHGVAPPRVAEDKCENRWVTTERTNRQWTRRPAVAVSGGRRFAVTKNPHIVRASQKRTRRQVSRIVGRKLTREGTQRFLAIRLCEGRPAKAIDAEARRRFTHGGCAVYNYARATAGTCVVAMLRGADRNQGTRCVRGR